MAPEEYAGGARLTLARGVDALRSLWKGTISFGLVTIPVKLYAATESKDLRFNLLHEPCHTPIQYRKYCPRCEREVEGGEIVKGYEVEQGRYVTLTDEDFESVPVMAKRTLEIVAFVRLEEIDPIYYDKTYYLEPGEGGAKAYALLRRAMEITGRVAIARVVIRSRESLAALRVFRDGVIAMETMHFPDEVRPTAGLTGITAPELRPQEIEMATGLIESLTTDFAPERFENEYRKALLDVIRAKAAGAPPALAQAAPEHGTVVDLMEALRASIAAAEGRRGAAPGTPAGVAETQAGVEGPGAPHGPAIEAEGPERPVPGIAASDAPVRAVPGTAAAGVPGRPLRGTETDGVPDRPGDGLSSSGVAAPGVPTRTAAGRRAIPGVPGPRTGQVQPPGPPAGEPAPGGP